MSKRASVFNIYEEVSDGNTDDIVTVVKNLFLGAEIKKTLKTRAGKTYIVNEPTKQYDSVLFSRFVCIYHKMFRKYFNIYDLSEEQCHDVIYVVFRRVMHAFNMDCLEGINTNKILGQYVCLAIKTSCAEQARRDRMYGSMLGDIRQKHNQIGNTDFVEIDDAFDVPDESQSPESHDIIYDLRDKLKNNPYGNAVLNALLDSDKRGIVHTWEVQKDMNLTDKERNDPQTKQYVLSAYKQIRQYIGKYRASIAQ